MVDASVQVAEVIANTFGVSEWVWDFQDKLTTMESLLYVPSAVIALFAIASLVLAFFTYRMNSSMRRLQESLTTPRLVIYSDLIDEDGREPTYTATIRNVGPYPALNVHVEINIEEWRDGHKVESEWNNRWDAFGDTIEVFQPQETREYELPTSIDSYIVAVKVVGSNCASVTARWSVVGDPRAFGKDAFQGKMDLRNVRTILDANSMKNIGKSDEDW